MTVCKRVTYKGHVQGVGFRYTAQQLAGGFAVTGYVRNLPGGDVELAVQGEQDQVAFFLAALARRMAEHIEQTSVDEIASGNYKGFQIRY